MRLDRLLGATVHQPRPPTGRSARRRSRGSSPSSARPAVGRTSIGVGGSGLTGAIGQVAGRVSRLADRADGLGLAPANALPAVGHRRDPGRAAGRDSHVGRDRRPGRRRRWSPGRQRSSGRRSSRRSPTWRGSPAWTAVSPDAIVLDDCAARRRATVARPTAAEEATRLLARTRGDPRRPDLHGQGARRPRRAGPARRARRPDRRVLARRRHARPVRAARLTGTLRPLLPGRPPRVADLHPAGRSGGPHRHRPAPRS